MLTENIKDKALVDVTGKVEERILTVIYNPDTDAVVTMRAASRKERMAYDIRSRYKSGI
jgi:uncharacterized DUF497 family protein